MSSHEMGYVSLLIISYCQSVFTETNGQLFWVKKWNNYLLLPHATILYWVLIIMEQSTPHTTLWASNSTGKHTCCGELWVSWVPSPRRPSRASDTRTETQQSSCVLIYCCHKSITYKQTTKWECQERLSEFENSWFVYCTIVSSSPGKYFSFIGHSENVGSTTWHLNQLITEEGLNYFGLSTK